MFKAKLRKKGALRVIERGALLSTTLGVLKGCAAVPKFFKDGASHDFNLKMCIHNSKN